MKAAGNGTSDNTTAGDAPADSEKTDEWTSTSPKSTSDPNYWKK